jgi:predicted RNase H-like HicB family nuclease
MTAIIEREDDGFVALCPELDIASQGSSVEEARANLVEALQLFFETAAPTEVAHRAAGISGELGAYALGSTAMLRFDQISTWSSAHCS